MLGAILLHNDAFNLAAEVIDSADFFRDAHRRIFDKMVNSSSGRRHRSSRSRTSSAGRRARRGRRAGLHRGAGRRRAPLDERRALRAHHQGEGDPPESDLLGQQDSGDRVRRRGGRRRHPRSGRARHFAIADDKVRDGFVSLRELAQSSLDTIEKLHARKELITGVPTGFTDLDDMTSGLQPSDLVIIAARPSMGKTSLVLNIAQHVGTKTT